MFKSLCQSCGMPMCQDERGGGTNADGSTSKEYCSHCYQNGTWMLPDITVDQMQERVGGRLKSVKLPKFIQQKAISGIPSLKRWSR
jgi:hypothetical protein